MDIPTNIKQDDLNRRDRILSAITQATEVFLRGSLISWQQNIFEVTRLLGKDLGIKRIYLCKNEHGENGQIVTGVRYEWLSQGDTTTVDAPALQEIDLKESGFSRWVEIFKKQGIIYSKVSDLPLGERGWFISAGAKSIIAVPVFVEQSWWGFICLEDYAPDEICSPAEVDAFKTVAVIFGAAIRRKRTEEALEREKKSVEQKAREVQDVARFPAEDPSPVLRVSKDGMVLYANRAATPLLQTWKIKLGERVPEIWQQKMHQVFTENRSEIADALVADRTFALLLFPVTQSDYINIYARDVTKEREVDRMKSDFIAMASHQLRTPLTTIRWYSDKILRKGENLNEKQVEWAKAVYETSVQLADLVDDLLNISRIERGKIEPQPKHGSLTVLLQSCINELDLQREKKGITLNLESQNLPDFMFDPDLIRQVQLNLISNAIKYTPQNGNISVKLSLKDDKALVEVRDNVSEFHWLIKKKYFSVFIEPAMPLKIVLKELDLDSLSPR